MLTEIEATYRVVTPMFCAGADPMRAEVRLPSFKGVLRFWWRALAWSRHAGNLETIKSKEDLLFGSSESGQSRVAMRLSLPAIPTTSPAGAVLKIPPAFRVVGEGCRYLGYGVMAAFASKKQQAGQLTRPCLAAPFDFTVQMRGRNLETSQLSSLKKALVALGTLGGMGSKSRKGYGSLCLVRLVVDGAEEWDAPRSLAELRAVIADLPHGNGASMLPEYTALSKDTRHVLLSSNKTECTDLLDLVGRELVRFRSWGHQGRVLGGESERCFKDDHDLMKAEPGRRQKHPHRIAFGLPHNYGKRPDQQVGPFEKNLDRRASPLFIHVHECGDTPVAVLSFLPAWFLPKGKSGISVGGQKIPQAPEDALYGPIHHFLDRLLDKNRRQEPFTQAVEVTP